MKKTNVAVVGLGGIAQLVHLPILSKLNSVNITAVSEINKNRLKTVGNKFNISNQYTDYKKMLNETEIDAVIIATPTKSHLEVSLEAIKTGKHVLIEKPIAVNYEEAKKINDAAKKYKVKAMVGMNFRFRPDAMLLKSMVNSGELGNLFYIRCGWSRKQSSEEKWFRKKTESGGGVLIDLGIVLLDLGIWFLDYPPVKSVSVQTYSHKIKGVEDSAVGFLRLKNGSVINFEVSWSLHSEKDSFNLTAFGTEGTGHLNPFRAYKRVDSARIDYTPTGSANIKNLYKKSYENELKHFISSVRGNTPFLSSSEEAIARMKLIEAIYESAEKEKEIILK
ncbi:putative oxidoreductase YcjS [bacterium BMS3Abin04]|nr:putative oxidoreductase YcjS [bacterium BMS3Abin04]